MEIVINIPEKDYKQGTLSNVFRCYSKELDAIIYNGIVLPKNHGRLIDTDAVKERMIPLDFSVQKWISEIDLDIYIPTIIEANKEIENDSERINYCIT